MIPYTALLHQLDIPNVRELEDLIIECIYQGVIKGKLDQKQKQLEIDFAIGRGIQVYYVLIHICMPSFWFISLPIVRYTTWSTSTNDGHLSRLGISLGCSPQCDYTEDNLHRPSPRAIKKYPYPPLYTLVTPPSRLLVTTPFYM